MRSITPGRKFSSTMSDFRTSAAKISLPCGFRRSRHMPLLAAVVDGEVDALPTDEGRHSTRLLAAEGLELDDLRAEIGEEHAAARPRLEARELEDADAVEGAAHFLSRTCTPAASSWSIHGAVESLSPQPRAIASTMICSATAASGIGTSYSRASSVASPMSLRASFSANRTVSKSPLKITFGSICESMRPWPKAAQRMAS